jgi:hypothetical protein
MMLLLLLLLEVVAGAMHVLQGLTSAPVTVYLPAEVLLRSWHGFTDWCRWVGTHAQRRVASKPNDTAMPQLQA